MEKEIISVIKKYKKYINKEYIMLLGIEKLAHDMTIDVIKTINIPIKKAKKLKMFFIKLIGANYEH
jgi:hypothetical protein